MPAPNTNADNFAHKFRELCEKHLQEAVVLVYRDPDSNASRIVIGPLSTDEFLNHASESIALKRKQRIDLGFKQDKED